MLFALDRTINIVGVQRTSRVQQLKPESEQRTPPGQQRCRFANCVADADASTCGLPEFLSTATESGPLCDG